MQTLYRKTLGRCINSYFKFVLGDNIEQCVYCIEEREFEVPVESSIVLQQVEFDNSMKYMLENSEQCTKTEWEEAVKRVKQKVKEMTQ